MSILFVRKAYISPNSSVKVSLPRWVASKYASNGYLGLVPVKISDDMLSSEPLNKSYTYYPGYIVVRIPRSLAPNNVDIDAIVDLKALVELLARRRG